ncbi:alanyl-tRNA editing protein [Desulfurococcaceae archaeon MEX13E-LK6-19]|nr:alanyl-tRNA editing protein [Desulfurococcaceae archaeon MEX13E-LK6-19]
MATELLYQKDSYVKEFTATIKAIEGNKIVLDKTAFNPRSGGLANDTGYIIKNEEAYKVKDVYFNKDTGEVIHVIEESEHNLSIGDLVKGVIDWDRRYKIMRLHTAAHILAAIMYNDYGALITGGSIYPDYAYDDYSLEKYDPEIFKEAIAKANDVVKQGIEVKIYWLKREEALKIPGIVKLASRMPPSLEFLRIVEIPGIDIQADGGPHVKNTKEIGEIVFIKAANKGKKKKRLYYTVKP